MLSSKSRYIGEETASSVNTSEVGVITAATDRMSTTECFLYRLMNVAERKPSLANIHERTGISNTIPIDRVKVIRVLI